MQKGSPYVEPINRKLRTLHESGLIQTWIQDLGANARKCESVQKIVASHGQEDPSLSLRQTETFFYIILGGYAVSGLGLVAEIIKLAYQKKNRRQRAKKKGKLHMAWPEPKSDPRPTAGEVRCADNQGPDIVDI